VTNGGHFLRKISHESGQQNQNSITAPGNHQTASNEQQYHKKFATKIVPAAEEP
jgi:hypothetical protein